MSSERGEKTVNKANRTLKQKAYQQLKEYLAITLYLWLVFGLFVLYKSVLLSEHGFSLSAHGMALFNALALGKIMLVARELHFADYISRRNPSSIRLFSSLSLLPWSWVVSRFSRKLALAGITANRLAKAFPRSVAVLWVEFSLSWRFSQSFWFHSLLLLSFVRA